MTRHVAADCMTAAKRGEKKIGLTMDLGLMQHGRPAVAYSQSDPDFRITDDGDSDDESRDVLEDATLPTLSHSLHTLVSEKRNSGSTVGGSSAQSRSLSPYTSLLSSTTSPSVYKVESFRSHSTANRQRRPSISIGRLKSSISTGASSKHIAHRPPVQPADFRIQPEQPEKRFVDTVGMIFPGVCDRQQCERPLAHFVTSFRLCEPIEYTTALADHGVTYEDYCRLVAALSNFLDDTSERSKRPGSVSSQVSVSAEPDEDKYVNMSLPERTKNTLFDTTEQFKNSKLHASTLNKLLGDITSNLQARGVLVMVCVHSFSLFSPSRISEAHIQVLHVSCDQRAAGMLASEKPTSSYDSNFNGRLGQRLSFIDVFSFAKAEERQSRPKLERQAVSATTTMTCKNGSTYNHQQSQFRDRSRPFALWPNAIPSNKRHILSPNIDRYGADPHFRAWIRAYINSKTRCGTYVKYLIEQEDDPFVNKRLNYADNDSRRGPIDVLMQEKSPSTLNRSKYDHNRRLECRKTTEHGFRLRVLRFGFRHPIFPPHTPEMETLGLSRDAYQSIVADIESIHTKVQLNTRCLGMYALASLNKVRRRSTESALKRVREYLRQLNASQRRIVWTIEKIPGVYDKGFARNRTEWEISAWNAEDPLELLIQLEKWGIIENRLSLHDDD